MASYRAIQEFVRGRYSFTPKTCWIARTLKTCTDSRAVRHPTVKDAADTLAHQTSGLRPRMRCDDTNYSNC